MRRIYPLALIVLLILTCLSLALNGVVIFILVRMRETAVSSMRDARRALDQIGEETVSYTVELDEEVPVEASFPFSHQVDVPINTTLPIDTSVVVPIDAGILGTIDVDVPIRTVIPVDIDVEVSINKTVDIATTVPVQFEVPVAVPISDTELADHLEALDEALARMERQLRDPLGGEGK